MKSKVNFKNKQSDINANVIRLKIKEFTKINKHTIINKSPAIIVKDGIPGKDGKNGKDGAIGPTGPVGPAGKDGKDGQPGKEGPVGPKGHDGKEGPTGGTGPKGKDGKDGQPGKEGPVGPKGNDGKDGQPGKDGLPGPAGKNGKDGQNGKDGGSGPTGPAGKDAIIPEIYNRIIKALGTSIHVKGVNEINSNNSEIYEPGSLIIGGSNNKCVGNSNMLIGSNKGKVYGEKQMLLGGEGLTLLHNDTYAMGHFNNIDNDYQLSLGNGISDEIRSNSFSIMKDGTVNTNKIILSDQMIPHVGIYYESFDKKKIPYGTAVTFQEGTRKIRPCLENETPIGVIVPTAYIIYGAAEDHWIDKYERNVDGKLITEFYEEIIYTPSLIEKEVEVIEEVIDYTKNPIEIKKVKSMKKIQEIEQILAKKFDENGKLLGEEKTNRMLKKFITKSRPKLSPKFDPKLTYVPRSKRDEWNIIAVAGLVKLNKNEMINLDWTLVEEHENYDYYLVK